MDAEPWTHRRDPNETLGLIVRFSGMMAPGHPRVAMLGRYCKDCQARAGKKTGYTATSHNMASLPGVVSSGYGRDDRSDRVANGCEAYGFRQSDAILASSSTRRLRSEACSIPKPLA